MSDIKSLPESTDKEYWGDGYSSRTELKKSDHVHYLVVRNRGVECDCGWRMNVSDPVTAQKIVDKVNN